MHMHTYVNFETLVENDISKAIQAYNYSFTMLSLILTKSLKKDEIYLYIAYIILFVNAPKYFSMEFEMLLYFLNPYTVK